MAKFTKYNTPNRRKSRRTISRTDADILAAKNMIDDRKAGVNLPLAYYDEQSDYMSGQKSRNIY